MTVEGLDLSHWDSPNEYSLTGKGFVAIKATEGTGYVDPGAGGHFAKARAAGVIMGAYHFARDDSGIASQGQWFLDNVPDDATFLAIDNEGAHVLTDAQCTALISYVRANDPLGRPILLYMSDSQFMACGQDYNWVAKWGSTPPSRNWLLWQYQSGSHNASGEDQDRYAGTIEQLRILIGAQGGAADMNSYNVPKVPSDVLVGNNKTIYTSDALDPNDPNRVIISPGRRMPFHGGPSGIGIVEYVTAAGAHTGKTYFAHSADLTNVLPIVTDDGYTAATQAAAVAAQKATDAAALSTAVASQKAADQVVIDAAKAVNVTTQAALDQALATAIKAQADLVTAAADERERLALALGKDEADKVRNS